jgi:RND family efflux transporter MFP subunit
MITTRFVGAAERRHVELDCVIEPHQIVEIRTPLEGTIEKILVDRGDIVKKDQILVLLESGQEKAAVDLWKFRSNTNAAINAAKTRVEVSVNKAKRFGDLLKQGIVSQSDFEEADAERQLAESQLLEATESRKISDLEMQRAVESLKIRTIKSPFAGLVMERFLNPGAVTFKDEKKPILKLAAMDPLYIEIIAPVSLLGRIKIGNKLEVFPEIPRGARYMAIVTRVDRVADSASGTFAIRAEMSNSKLLLQSGVKGKVRMVVN